MFQSLVDRKRRGQVIGFGVLQRLVQIIKLNALVVIVAVNRFQTGNIGQKRQSRQTAGHNNRVLASGLPQLKRLALLVITGRIGQGLPD